MVRKIKLSSEERTLIRRYLVWCYKTTKEQLDKIDRKTTQLTVDHFVLKELVKNQRIKNTNLSELDKKIGDFKKYIQDKKAKENESKYTDSDKRFFQPEYLYLKSRLNAIETAIRHFLGQKALVEIKGLYEKEMTKRILEARDHT